MDETNATPLSNGEDNQPGIGIVSQYVKDLSFENPNSPAIFSNQNAPKIDVQFNIGATQVGEGVTEVVLKIDVRAEAGDQIAYVVELAYAGLFAFRNFPADQMQPFVLGEAPRLLFPFARRILADAIRDGGFPQLVLEPIDFNGLYLQQLEAQQAGIETQGVVGNA